MVVSHLSWSVLHIYHGAISFLHLGNQSSFHVFERNAQCLHTITMEEKSSYSPNSHPKQTERPSTGKSRGIHETGIATQGSSVQLRPGSGLCVCETVLSEKQGAQEDMHTSDNRAVSALTHIGRGAKGGGGCKSLYLNVPWLFYFPVK